MKLSFIPDDMDWTCEPCGVKLEPGMVQLDYLGSVFKVELPVCPRCSRVLISEELATGKILEVERLLEDK